MEQFQKVAMYVGIYATCDMQFQPFKAYLLHVPLALVGGCLYWLVIYHRVHRNIITVCVCIYMRGRKETLMAYTGQLLYYPMICASTITESITMSHTTYRGELLHALHT